jgi:hypothetical protein
MPQGHQSMVLKNALGMQIMNGNYFVLHTKSYILCRQIDAAISAFDEFLRF